ncbi:MAG TPA: hydantoinase/oxoprolinase family protein [Solirubrobacteraceae bacterium]|nr:hydantoinase/oxoprolinase family protein [Solirubrobacteraceae bacterium]
MLLGVDVGGSFTDAVILAGGELFAAKTPTTPADESRGVMAAVEAVLARAGAGSAEISRFAHGMTVATNALLEGRGARAALIATDGFTDVVELGRQARAELYRPCAAHPPPLVPPELRFPADERTGPDGILMPLTGAADLVELVAAARPEAVAVVLLHSYAHPDHERRLGELLAERLPGVHVSLSHEVVGTLREYERAATTEIDAALSPLLAGYLDRLGDAARDAGLPDPQIMQSSGGLTDIRRAAAHAALTVLSGPAGGAHAASLLAASAGVDDVLCFDMGGTSCDVCVIDDREVSETADRRVGGRPLALTTLDIHTVGAGGGSIAWRDPGGALRVGPQSAGARPGPACYGQGGERPTVTDANLLLGRLGAGVRLAGGLELDADAAVRAIGALAGELDLDPLDCAAGIIRVANAEMVRALRVMSVERGVDPRGYALMPFGGAGPLHACAVADELGIRRILCPRSSGVLCALGLAAAPARRDAAGSHGGANVAALRRRVRDELGGEPDRERFTYEQRYVGQSFELATDAPPDADAETLRAGFEEAHQRRYGYTEPGLDVELVTVRVSAFGPAPAAVLRAATGTLDRRTCEVRFDGDPVDTELLVSEPPAGAAIDGPAICAMPETTLLVAPGWSGRVRGDGTIDLRRAP